MNEYEVQRVQKLVNTSIELGFSMGVVAMRLKVMEIVQPYLDQDVLTSDLLTSRDVMRMIFEGLNEFDNDVELAKMSAVVNQGKE